MGYDVTVTYLAPYGYVADGPQKWQALPESCPGCPVLTLMAEGHSKVEGHTLYKVRCRIEGGQGLISWHVTRRLSQIRQGVYQPVFAALCDDYAKLFSQTPFARHGGLRGTTTRLTKWLANLARCVNQGKVHPELLASILVFFEAPTLPDHGEEFPATWIYTPDPPAELKSHHESLEQCQAQVQSLFYEELRKRFEYECAERCFGLQCRGIRGIKLVEEVLQCLIENLEDARVRMEARACMWDDGQQCLVTLDSARREQLQRDLTDHLEPALLMALAAAAVAASEDGPCGRSLRVIASRRNSLESDCAELLRQKTLASEEFQDLEEQLMHQPSVCSSNSSSTRDPSASPLASRKADPSTPSTCSPDQCRSVSGKKRTSFLRSLARPRK